MIVAPHVKTALREALEDAGCEFAFTETDGTWAPKLWMFLDGSLVESSTTFDIDEADPCVSDLYENSSVFIYAVSIAEDDGPTVTDIELDVARFTSLLVKTITADTTLGVDVDGCDFVRVLPVSNETSTRQMQSAGGQPYNACRAFIEISIRAHINTAQLDTTY